jgi:hypothetical protein
MLARNRFIYSARILITHDFTPTLQIGGRWVFKTSHVQGNTGNGLEKEDDK